MEIQCTNIQQISTFESLINVENAIFVRFLMSQNMNKNNDNNFIILIISFL